MTHLACGDIYFHDPGKDPCLSQGLESWACQGRAQANRAGGRVAPQEKKHASKRGIFTFAPALLVPNMRITRRNFDASSLSPILIAMQA